MAYNYTVFNKQASLLFNNFVNLNLPTWNIVRKSWQL